MNNFVKLLLCSLGLMFFQACDEKVAEKETQPPTETRYEVREDSITFSIPVSNILKTDSGVFRGISFGTPADQVKILEDTLYPQEESDHQIEYLFNYNFLESAEIIYYLDNKQVSKIETVVYPENKESQKNLYDELVTFYTNRYGTGEYFGDTLRWQSDLDNLTLSITKVDTHKVHDITLLFAPMDDYTINREQ